MEIHSHHIFMFPFQFTKRGEKEEINLYDVSSLLGTNWVRDDSENPELDYNQRNFFYRFDVLENISSLVNRLVSKDITDKKYVITINRKIIKERPEPLLRDEILRPERPVFQEKPFEFELDIDKVTLDIYKNRIGVFAFHLSNYTYSDPSSILLINQYGRRIYTPFKDTHYRDFEIGLKTSLEGTKHRELAENITIKQRGIELCSEKFEQVVYGNKFILPEHITHFVKLDDTIEIKPLLDDRMFVMCWYGSEQLGYDFKIKKWTAKQEKEKYKYCISSISDRIKGGYEVTSAYRNSNQHRSLALNESFDGYGYAVNDFWYQYVFVDSYSPSVCNELLKREQLLKHTYDRWVGCDTLYGVTRYSFVCITQPLKILKKPEYNTAFILDHFQTMYFRMVSLVFVQRAMIVDFSGQIAELTEKSDSVNDFIEHSKKLNKEYYEFIEKIYFCEVTTQEQGIELYDLLQKHMRTEDHAKKMETEFDSMRRRTEILIAELDAENNLINNRRNKLIEERNKKISQISAIIATPTIILAITNHQLFKELPSIWFGSGHDWCSGTKQIALLITMLFCDYLVFRSLFLPKTQFPETSKFKVNGKMLIVACIVFIIYLILFQNPFFNQ